MVVEFVVFISSGVLHSAKIIVVLLNIFPAIISNEKKPTIVILLLNLHLRSNGHKPVFGQAYINGRLYYQVISFNQDAVSSCIKVITQY